MIINGVFSKSLLLITTDGRIRKRQMDKKPCFYNAVLAPQVRKQSVWLVSFWLYLLLDVWCILGDKQFSNFKSMRNAHARIISVSLWYRRLLFAPKYKTFYDWASEKMFYTCILFMYMFFVLKPLKGETRLFKLDLFTSYSRQLSITY